MSFSQVLSHQLAVTALVLTKACTVKSTLSQAEACFWCPRQGFNTQNCQPWKFGCLGAMVAMQMDWTGKPHQVWHLSCWTTWLELWWPEALNRPIYSLNPTKLKVIAPETEFFNTTPVSWSWVDVHATCTVKDHFTVFIITGTIPACHICRSNIIQQRQPEIQNH